MAITCVMGRIITMRAQKEKPESLPLDMKPMGIIFEWKPYGFIYGATERIQHDT